MRPCHLIHPVPVPDVCRRCWEYLNIPAFREIWDRPEIVTNAPYTELVGEAYTKMPSCLKIEECVKPCRVNHPSSAHNPECPACQKWEADPKFREAWEKYYADFPEQILKTPCRHRSAEIPLTERHKYGLGTTKQWFRCGLGFGENGIVCPCTGCNIHCVGYELPEDPSMIND